MPATAAVSPMTKRSGCPGTERSARTMGKKVQVDRALDAMAYVPADNGFGNEYFQKGGIINQH